MMTPRLIEAYRPAINKGSPQFATVGSNASNAGEMVRWSAPAAKHDSVASNSAVMISLITTVWLPGYETSGLVKISRRTDPSVSILAMLWQQSSQALSPRWSVITLLS